MKASKLFGVKSITNLIYGLLLILPMVAVLSRTIYVQSNDNAKDSYYGETINEESINNASSLITNVKYNTLYPTGIPINLTNSNFINIESITFLNANNNVAFNTLKSHENEYWRFRYIYNAQNINLEFQRRVDDNNVSDYYSVVIAHSSNPSYYSIEFEFYVAQDLSDGLTTILPYTTYITYNKYSFLDNAFEYSLYTFTEENNVDSIDFFGWFTNLFLNQNNTHNAVYLGFANWYMNYTLLVSSAYLLFFALLWFVNYVRKILEKSSYHDFGGF